MRLYCLTYDAVNSKEEYKNGETIKDEIVEVLKKGGAKILSSPVESTIVFGGANKITYWENLILQHFKERLYFFLCLIACNVGEIEHFYRMRPNKDLDAEFRRSSP